MRLFSLHILFQKKSLEKATLYNPHQHSQGRSAVFILQMMTPMYRKVKELDPSHTVTATQCDSVRLQLSFTCLESRSFAPHSCPLFPPPLLHRNCGLQTPSCPQPPQALCMVQECENLSSVSEPTQKLGLVVSTCNSNAGEVEVGKSLGFTG